MMASLTSSTTYQMPDWGYWRACLTMVLISLSCTQYFANLKAIVRGSEDEIIFFYFVYHFINTLKRN
jgi:hypothetical protein